VKQKECAKCGCNRNYLVEAKVHLNERGVTAKFAWLCVPCLLTVMTLDVPGSKDKYNRKKAMACVGDKP
jgi:hypothetical protein